MPAGQQVVERENVFENSAKVVDPARLIAG